jgi:hypothetical protein
VVLASRLLCVLCELCVKPDLLFAVFRSFHDSYSPFVSGCGAFLLKISGTSTKKRPKYPLFNNFPVPHYEWDKPGTTLGHAIQRDTKSFFKNREKLMKIEPKRLKLSNLRFSRGHEKGVKNISG